MLNDQRRLSVLWVLRPIVVLAILLPALVRHGDTVPFRWYFVGAGVAGSFAIDICQSVLTNRLRRAAAGAVRAEYRRAR
jgi:hypothetical protein